MKYFLALLALCFSAASQSLVVLQYHHVSDKAPRSTSISPSLFFSHLQYLHDQNFKVMDIRELPALLSSGKSLPDKTVIITFDDGYKSVYNMAFPALKKRNWPFTVFVNTKAHDEKHPHFASWAQLREMSQAGAHIANHTDSHVHLIRQRSNEGYRQWQQRREDEITFAAKRIAKEIGEPSNFFAYPYGEYDQKLLSLLKRLGYLAFGQQSGPIAKASHRQALPRFAFGGGYGQMSDFVTKVNSLPFPESRVKVTSLNGKSLDEPLLPDGTMRPILRIASPLMPYIDQFACYASGMGKIDSTINGGVLVATAPKSLPVGRSRYNCTAHAGGGRYYWHSQLFIRRFPDGSWPDE